MGYNLKAYSIAIMKRAGSTSTLEERQQNEVRAILYRDVANLNALFEDHIGLLFAFPAEETAIRESIAGLLANITEAVAIDQTLVAIPLSDMTPNTAFQLFPLLARYINPENYPYFLEALGSNAVLDGIIRLPLVPQEQQRGISREASVANGLVVYLEDQIRRSSQIPESEKQAYLDALYARVFSIIVTGVSAGDYDQTNKRRAVTIQGLINFLNLKNKKISEKPTFL